MDDILRIELELTNTCNLKCPLCIRQTHMFEKNNKNFRSIESIINQLETFNNLKYITIAGQTSEPTLYPQLFELLKYIIIDRNIELSLYINGETFDDLYYKKLGLLFRNSNSHVYLTICGSTNKIHSKYRVGSCLETIIRRYNIISTFSNNKCILTWIIFNYNYDDYNQNKFCFVNYNLEVFNTLPINAAYNLQNLDFDLPNKLNKIYDSLDKNVKPIECMSDKNHFRIIDFKGDIYPCSMFKNFGTTYCYECENKNYNKLHSNNIFALAESESETSEEKVRYDIK